MIDLPSSSDIHECAAETQASRSSASVAIPPITTHRVTHDHKTLPSLQQLEAPETTSPAGKENQVRPNVAVRCELEGLTRFSQSHLWKLMMSFYDRQGVDSWSSGIVPHFITSNVFIAHAYVKVLSGYLADVLERQKIDPDEPLYLVELGAGSGKFSFYMVQALERLQHELKFPLSNIKYIMTDFTTQNFDFWTKHPALASYVDRGLIDFAIFDATNDHSLTLARSKLTLSKGSVKNPLVIVANYLFDTLYHDLFQVDKGVLKEGLVSTGSKLQHEPDPLDPAIIKRLSNTFAYEGVEDRFYTTEEGQEESLNNMLEWYRQYYEQSSNGATVLVPIGALRAIRRLSAISGQRALIISGDKGHNNPDHFRGLVEPHIAIHGSFSVMVNYHAVGSYITERGGFALHNPQEEASLKVATFVLDGEHPVNESGSPILDLDVVSETRSEAYPTLRRHFQEYLVDFGPNDFFVMQKSLKEDASKPALKGVVALLKLSRWDPAVFYKFRDAILDQIPSCGQKLRNDLSRGIPTIWQNYYMLDKEKDIAFEIGRYFYGIRDYDQALAYYRISTDKIGPHHVTYHNMGLCHYSRSELPIALQFFDKAVGLCATYAKAKTWRDRVKSELGAVAIKDVEVQLNGQVLKLSSPELVGHESPVDANENNNTPEVV